MSSYRAFWKGILGSLLRGPYLPSILAFALLVSLKSKYGIFDFKSKELLGLILPISGTIVALALPTAQLAMDMMKKAEEESLKILSKDTKAGAEYVLSEMPEYKEKFTLAWRALLYALLSFLLSAIASLGPYLGSVTFDLIVTSSLGSLVVSALFFYPVVLFALHLKTPDVVIASAKIWLIPREEARPTEHAGPGPKGIAPTKN